MPGQVSRFRRRRPRERSADASADADHRAADYLVVESTYGDRLHPPATLQPRCVIWWRAPLRAAAASDSGVRGRACADPVSPLPVATAANCRRCRSISTARWRLMPPRFIASLPANTNCRSATIRRCCRMAKFIRTPDESKSSASEGADDRHFRQWHGYRRTCSAPSVQMAPDERNTILFTGFQSGGTRGATLVGGADVVKIFIWRICAGARGRW